MTKFGLYGLGGGMKSELDLQNIPQHVAIVMDGNGRWAKKRLLPKSAGHKAGAQALRKLAAEAEKLGIKCLTVYAFSTENWSRPREEVDYLMGLLRDYIQQYIDDKDKNEMRILVIGDRDRLDDDLIDRIDFLENYTKNKKGMTVVIALNYGGRDELIRAVKKFGRELLRDTNPLKRINELDEKELEKFLDTWELMPPDLVIRTSGEQRLSNFLLWQSAYSELYFTDKLWPDFNIQDLKAAVAVYQQRERRYGGRNEV